MARYINRNNKNINNKTFKKRVNYTNFNKSTFHFNKKQILDFASQSLNYDRKDKMGIPLYLENFRKKVNLKIKSTSLDKKARRPLRIRVKSDKLYLINFTHALFGAFIFQGKLMKSYNMVTAALKEVKKKYKISYKTILRRVSSILRIYFLKKIRYRGRKKYWFSYFPKNWKIESRRVCFNLKRFIIKEGKAHSIKNKLSKELLNIMKFRNSRLLKKLNEKKSQMKKKISK